MSKIIILTIACFFSFVGLSAQLNSEIVNINWIEAVGADSLDCPVRFENQNGIDDSGWPVLIMQYPLNDKMLTVEGISVRLEVFKEEAFNAIEGCYIENLSDETFHQIKKNIVTIRKRNYLELIITPVVYHSETDVFNKILRFKLDVKLPDVKASSARLKSNSTVEVAAHSVLKSGKWLKVCIAESGVHKIPYSVLSSWGFTNGANVKVFGNGGNMLPKSNSISRLDDLTENAVLHYNNAIYFYAQGSIAWRYDESRGMFVHQIHDYTDEAYYFLTDEVGEGLTVAGSDEIYESFTHETGEYDSYTYYELEHRNLIKSGRTWYGMNIYPSQQREYNFIFKNLVSEKPLKLLTEVVGYSNVSSTMKTFINSSESPLQSMSIQSVKYGDQTGSVANQGVSQSSFYVASPNVNVSLQYNTSSSSAYGNLNYFCLNARERIVLDKQLQFRNAEVAGSGNVTRFYFENTSDKTVLWDVSNHTHPVKLELQSYEGQSGVTTSTEYIKEFVLFNPDAALLQPSLVGEVENQDLHGADVPEMLIVTHPLFKEQALRLAQLHNKKSGLQCLVVEPQQIYNEFSSGQPDVSAIRDFARFLYQKSDRFKNMLLFGDGSYDNRSRDDENTNFIMTYQSVNSIKISDSYVTDDFYACLDDGEGEDIQFDKLDIGIGRLPVGSLKQAKEVVDKIENYLFNPWLGPWKATLTFVGDDGDNNQHMIDADALARKVEQAHPEFDINKIYFDAYKKTSTSSGVRYPDVNEAIQNAITQGTLVFNYTGHGSEQVLSHEQVLTIGDIKNLSNKDRLPLFATATCEFSRYDDKHLVEGSAGEIVLTTPNGGGIALLTTTRIAWSSSNLIINNNLYNYLFEKDEYGEKLRLGDIIRRTKNASGNTINKLNFALLGDPALRLNYPVNKIFVDNINGEANPIQQDTLKALTQVNIEGVIGDGQGSLFDKGSVTMKVFDKPVKITTLGNGGATPFEYEVYQNRIFKGEVDVENDCFSASFIVPKDIRYNVGNGRISFYGSDNNQVEAFGANNSIKVGSISDNPPDDEAGPEIKVWLNDTGFTNGDVVGIRPVLYAGFHDESGINTSGVGIGHDLSLVINEDRSNYVVLNDYYSAKNNDFTRGDLSYQLPSLPVGKHTLYLKAWDNLNNSSTVKIDFIVEQKGELSMKDIMIWPNPVKPGETLKVSFKHDVPNSMLESTLCLFDLSGRPIDEVSQQVVSYGNAISPLDYSLPANLNKGLYILQGDFEAGEGQKGRFSKKILVIR